MIVKELLDRKREGRELEGGEIRELVGAYVRGDVTDSQMAAFAMAVCCRGMSAAETDALVDSMRRSGVSLEWDLPFTADKHSTGGVGDKLSLIVQPLAAACGLHVPSLTGRGLGFTGGTADKMESIPGYSAALPLGDFKRVVADCGVSIATQTEEIAPADRKLYALRDATGTVPSIPLIVASILSKKLAEGAETLVFDVKCGEGAFMASRDDAVRLARALTDGAKAAGRRAAALVTAMDEPLGFAVGNAMEVDEAVDVLKGAEGPRDVKELSLRLAALMVALAKGVSPEAARAECDARLADGSAYGRFAEMVRLQGGDLSAFERRTRPEGTVVVADRSGFVLRVGAAAVAAAAFTAGAGRAKAGDAIDRDAGVLLRVRRGDRVEKGDAIATVVARADAGAVAEKVRSAVEIGDTPPSAAELVLEEIP